VEGGSRGSPQEARRAELEDDFLLPAFSTVSSPDSLLRVTTAASIVLARVAILGATGHVGSGAAHAFLEAGHHVALVGRDAAKLDELKASGRPRGCRSRLFTRGLRKSETNVCPPKSPPPAGHAGQAKRVGSAAHCDGGG
jgi:hypothetical protein